MLTPSKCMDSIASFDDCISSSPRFWQTPDFHRFEESTEAMFGKNQRLVTNELVEFKVSRLKLETSGELPIISEESIEDYT